MVTGKMIPSKKKKGNWQNDSISISSFDIYNSMLHPVLVLSKQNKNCP